MFALQIIIGIGFFTVATGTLSEMQAFQAVYKSATRIVAI